MSEKKLAHSVHVGGRRYRRGMTAAEIGADAKEIGEHAWEGYDPQRSSGSGAIVESRSGLPGGAGTTSIPLVAPDGGEVDQDEVERRLTPAATVPDGLGGDGTSPIPGATAETVEAAAGDADAAKPDGSVKKPTSTEDGGTQPAKKAAPAKRTGTSRNGSGS